MTDAGGVLLAYSEVYIKRGRRTHFLNELQRNVMLRLRSRRGLRVIRPFGRIVVLPVTPGERLTDALEIAEAASSVFGIDFASPCEVLAEPTLDTLAAATWGVFESARRRSDRTFRIDASRVDKRFPIGSRELNRELGARVLAQAGEMTVDLSHPDVSVRVEIRQRMTFVFSHLVPGVGGLPVGTAGRGLLLLSGGIDSPVAGWLALKRGVALDALTFLSPPHTGPHALEKTRDLARHLAHCGGHTLSHTQVRFTAIQEHLRMRAPPELLVLLYRRSMLRIADAVATVRGAQVLITGDSVGQVASQTLENLACIGAATSRLVLRPLVTYDKKETMALARRIGTLETSQRPHDDCCSLFVPRHPALHGRADVLAAVEAGCDLTALEAMAVEEAQVETYGQDSTCKTPHRALRSGI